MIVPQEEHRAVCQQLQIEGEVDWRREQEEQDHRLAVSVARAETCEEEGRPARARAEENANARQVGYQGGLTVAERQWISRGGEVVGCRELEREQEDRLRGKNGRRCCCEILRARDGGLYMRY